MKINDEYLYDLSGIWAFLVDYKDEGLRQEWWKYSNVEKNLNMIDSLDQRGEDWKNEENKERSERDLHLSRSPDNYSKKNGGLSEIGDKIGGWIRLPNCWNIIEDLDRYEGVVWFYKTIKDSKMTKFLKKIINNDNNGSNNEGQSDLDNVDKELFMELGAANYKTTIWINGIKIGTNEGNFQPFSFYIDSAIIREYLEKELPLFIAIRIENFRRNDRVPCRSKDWYNWGGIYRYLKLIAKNKVRIEDLRIIPEIGDPKNIIISIKKEDSNAVVSFSKNTSVVLKFKLKLKNPNIKDTPNYLIRYTIYPVKFDEEMIHTLENRSDIGRNKSLKQIKGEKNILSLNYLNILLIKDILGKIDLQINEKGNIFLDAQEIFREYLEKSNPIVKGDISISQEPAQDIIFDEKISLAGKEIALWSPEMPNLYIINIKLYEEINDPNKNDKNTGISERKLENYYCIFGFRRVETERHLLLLNYKPIKLYGVSLHEERIPYGRTIPLDQRIKDIISIKELGFNALRTGHYPHDEIIYSLTDAAGLVVLEEIPVYWGINFADENILKLAARMLKKMIYRDFHHPSIIMWSVGNEIPATSYDCKIFMKKLLDLGRKLDPTRLVSFVNEPFSASVIPPSLLKKSDIFCINSYFGWYYLTPYNLNFFLDSLHYIDKDKPIFITEFGAGARFGIHALLQDKMKFSEEYQA
ncbi:MAG: glycoside hydrolase family 2 protein, partial [Promethearchaeota archaeon]